MEHNGLLPHESRGMFLPASLHVLLLEATVSPILDSVLPEASQCMVASGGVPGTGFWNGASTSKQYFVLPNNGSKYHLQYTFLAFPILGILAIGTPLVASSWVGKRLHNEPQQK